LLSDSFPAVWSGWELEASCDLRSQCRIGIDDQDPEVALDVLARGIGVVDLLALPALSTRFL
jgi:hypothetical protein